jgi:hypothetical protein
VKLLMISCAFCLSFLLFGCAGTSSSITNIPDPVNDNVLVIGNVIVENIR